MCFNFHLSFVKFFLQRHLMLNIGIIDLLWKIGTFAFFMTITRYLCFKFMVSSVIYVWKLHLFWWIAFNFILLNCSIQQISNIIRDKTEKKLWYNSCTFTSFIFTITYLRFRLKVSFLIDSNEWMKQFNKQKVEMKTVFFFSKTNFDVVVIYYWSAFYLYWKAYEQKLFCILTNKMICWSMEMMNHFRKWFILFLYIKLVKSCFFFFVLLAILLNWKYKWIFSIFRFVVIVDLSMNNHCYEPMKEF